MSEIWKDIIGYEGSYQVSDLGRIRSLARTILRDNGITQSFKERMLRPGLGVNGKYLTVALYDARKRKKPILFIDWWRFIIWTILPIYQRLTTQGKMKMELSLL